MTYQVNMTTNAEIGFTEADLEEVLRSCAESAAPPLEVGRGENESLELRRDGKLLVSLFPAGQEPFDYLLVDFIDGRGWDQAPQIIVVAAMAERLDLTVLELESHLEYSPREWAATRARYHAPDPLRESEAREIEIAREIEFYRRQGIPYTTEERELIQESIEAPDDVNLQASVQDLRDRKKIEGRGARRSWWLFGRWRGADGGRRTKDGG